MEVWAEEKLFLLKCLQRYFHIINLEQEKNYFATTYILTHLLVQLLQNTWLIWMCKYFSDGLLYINKLAMEVRICLPYNISMPFYVIFTILHEYLGYICF